MVREAVFKITENCPCNCAFCDSKEKFENILKRKIMSFEEWKIITDKLLKSGLEVVILSGGEPLLKEDLTFKLMHYLQENGVYVVLNASGVLFNNSELLERIKRNYPNLLVFSVDSAYAENHDKNRRTPGVFDRVVNSIKIIKKSDNYPVAIRTVITRSNYKELPKIIGDFNGYGVDCIKLTNIENDMSGEFRLSLDDLNLFDSQIRNEIIAVLEGCQYQDPNLGIENLRKIRTLLDRNKTSYEDLSLGYFSPSLVGHALCDLGGHFFAIQSNGDVLPCCEAEHHYVPLLGNLLKSNVDDIYGSEVYERFKEERPDYCVTCTQSHNLQLNFSHGAAKVNRR